MDNENNTFTLDLEDAYYENIVAKGKAAFAMKPGHWVACRALTHDQLLGHREAWLRRAARSSGYGLELALEMIDFYEAVLLCRAEMIII